MRAFRRAMKQEKKELSSFEGSSFCHLLLFFDFRTKIFAFFPNNFLICH